MAKSVRPSAYRCSDPHDRGIVRDYLAGLLPAVQVDAQIAKKVAKVSGDEKQVKLADYYGNAVSYVRFLLAQNKPDGVEVIAPVPPREEYPDGRPLAS